MGVSRTVDPYLLAIRLAYRIGYFLPRFKDPTLMVGLEVEASSKRVERSIPSLKTHTHVSMYDVNIGASRG
jgi:hypothetical protein